MSDFNFKMHLPHQHCWRQEHAMGRYQPGHAALQHTAAEPEDLLSAQHWAFFLFSSCALFSLNCYYFQQEENLAIKTKNIKHNWPRNSAVCVRLFIKGIFIPFTLKTFKPVTTALKHPGRHWQTTSLWLSRISHLSRIFSSVQNIRSCSLDRRKWKGF